MTKIETIDYRGEIIQLCGNGYLYAGMLWPTLAGVHNAIDNKLDDTKKSIFVDDYFPKQPPPDIKFYPNDKD